MEKKECDYVFETLKEMGYNVLERRTQDSYYRRNTNFIVNERYFKLEIKDINYSHSKKICIETKRGFDFENRDDGITRVYSTGLDTRRYLNKISPLDKEKLKNKIDEIIQISKGIEENELNHKIYEINKSNEESRNKNIVSNNFGFLMSKASSYPYEDGFFLDEKNKEVYHINLSEDGDKFFDLSFFGGSCRRNGLDKKESIEFITEIKRIHNFFKSDKLLVGGL